MPAPVVCRLCHGEEATCDCYLTERSYISFSKAAPPRMLDRRLLLVKRLRTSGVDYRTAEDSVKWHMVMAFPVATLFDDAPGAPVLEYLHVIRVSRPAYLRLTRLGITLGTPKLTTGSN